MAADPFYPLLFKTKSDYRFYSFVKLHTSNNKKYTFPLDKTIIFTFSFPWISFANFQQIFSGFGKLEKVVINDKELDPELEMYYAGWNGTCHVVFEEKIDSKYQDFIETYGISDHEFIWDCNAISSLESHAHFERICKPFDLANKVKEALHAFDTMEKEELLRKRQEASQPDADGFVKVTRLNRRNTNRNADATVGALSLSEAQSLKAKDHAHKDFYRFQTRETKREQLLELRRKFQKDKERIEKLKQTRKFKPY